MFKFNKILVPTDFSEQFEIALSYAKELAQSTNAELHILHVIEHVVYPADVGIAQASFIDLEIELNNKSLAQLELLKNEMANENIETKIAVLIGKPSDQIIEYAYDQKVDLICIATHGRSGFEHLLFGSTTEKVLRKAPCPVLAVRKPSNR